MELTQARVELSLEAARARSVMICTPMGDRPAPQYVVSLTRSVLLLQKLGIRQECRFVLGSSNLPRARNQLAAELLASDYSDLLFVDDDMSWQPDAIVRLLASEHPVIGAAGRKKCDKLSSDGEAWCVKWLSETMRQDPLGAIEVAGVGTGFLRIARGALEAMIARRPEIERRGELVPGRKTYHRFFYWGDNGEREQSEDFQFCDDWRETGGTVWIDPKIALGHIGAKDYGGSIDELLVPREPASLSAAAPDDARGLDVKGEVPDD